MTFRYVMTFVYCLIAAVAVPLAARLAGVDFLISALLGIVAAALMWLWRELRGHP